MLRREAVDAIDSADKKAVPFRDVSESAYRRRMPCKNSAGRLAGWHNPDADTIVHSGFR